MLPPSSSSALMFNYMNKRILIPVVFGLSAIASFAQEQSGRGASGASLTVTNAASNPLYVRCVSYIATNTIGVYNGGAAGTTATTSGNVYSTFQLTLPTGPNYSGRWWLSWFKWTGGTNGAVDIFLFNTNTPAYSEAVQGSAWAYNAETDSIWEACPVISLTSFTQKGNSAPNIAYTGSAGNLNYPIIPADGSNIYGVVINRSAVTNYPAAQVISKTNYTISFGFLRD